jgi:hypothetical protein
MSSVDQPFDKFYNDDFEIVGRVWQISEECKGIGLLISGKY